MKIPKNQKPYKGKTFYKELYPTLDHKFFKQLSKIFIENVGISKHMIENTKPLTEITKYQIMDRFKDKKTKL